MKIERLSVLLVVCVVLSGCGDPAAREARAIVALPPPQRREALSRLPAEKQLDIYLYASTRMEPPMILADDMAGNWKEILPAVRNRLASEADETKAFHLVTILVAVGASHCSLAQRKDVLDAASRAVQRMNEPYKQLAQQELTDLARPPRELSPCQ